MRLIVALNILLIFASVAVTAIGLVRSTGGVWSEEMVLWLMPYEVLFAMQILLYLAKPIRRAVVWSAFVSSLLVFLFVLQAYGPHGVGSTSGLLYLFAPYYILIGGPSIFLGGVWIGYMFSRWPAFKAQRPEQPPRCAKCGYLPIGLSESRCPECAQPFSRELLSDCNDPREHLSS